MEARKNLIKTISTFFYIGYLPLIPGTFGSIAGAWLFYFFRGNILAYAVLLFLLIALGFLVSGEAERIVRQKDARCIVIDEVCGMMISFMFIPFDWRLFIIGFMLFRILDTLKPYPAGRLQHVNGSIGIMSDDIVAAVYTNIILQAVARLAVFKGS